MTLSCVSRERRSDKERVVNCRAYTSREMVISWRAWALACGEPLRWVSAVHACFMRRKESCCCDELLLLKSKSAPRIFNGPVELTGTAEGSQLERWIVMDEGGVEDGGCDGGFTTKARNLGMAIRRPNIRQKMETRSAWCCRPSREPAVVSKSSAYAM